MEVSLKFAATVWVWCGCNEVTGSFPHYVRDIHYSDSCDSSVISAFTTSGFSIEVGIQAYSRNVLLVISCSNKVGAVEMSSLVVWLKLSKFYS